MNETEQPRERTASKKINIIVLFFIVLLAIVIGNQIRITNTNNNNEPDTKNLEVDQETKQAYQNEVYYVDDIIVNKPNYTDNFPIDGLQTAIYTNVHFFKATDYTNKFTGFVKKIGTYNSVRIVIYAYTGTKDNKTLIGTNSTLINFEYLNEIKSFEITFDTTKSPSFFVYELLKP